MPASLIDGRTLAAARRARVAEDSRELAGRLGRPPGLAVVLVGEVPASLTYVRSKRRVCEELGIRTFDHDLPDDFPEKDLLDLIAELNRDARVDGILVQLPLPGHVRADRVLGAIDPAKDVDGLHPLNLGLLFGGRPALVPCTPAGVMEMLGTLPLDLAGAEAVVVGRSNLMGKPMAALLINAHATVTVCHSRTRDLAGHCRRADVLVVAVGRPALVRGDWIKPGAAVIDVGMNRVDGRLCGDVACDEVRERAGYLTPVPGGVGPMTIAHLMANTVAAARRRVLEER